VKRRSLKERGFKGRKTGGGKRPNKKTRMGRRKGSGWRKRSFSKKKPRRKKDWVGLGKEEGGEWVSSQGMSESIKKHERGKGKDASRKKKGKSLGRLVISALGVQDKGGDYSTCEREDGKISAS